MNCRAPRGPASEWLVAALRRSPHDLPVRVPADDEDLQVTLFICYELHYRGFAGVNDRWEWQPSLLALRAATEDSFERRLRAAVGPLADVAPARVGRALVDLVGRR
jgi:hypothetical protein